MLFCIVQSTHHKVLHINQAATATLQAHATRTAPRRSTTPAHQNKSMWAPIHRALLPCLHQLHSTSSSQESFSVCTQQPQQHPHNTQQAGLPNRQQQQPFSRAAHSQADAASAGKLQPLPHVSQLTDQQKQELKQAVVGSFQQDPQAASRLLAKSLSHDAKRHLLSVLEGSEPGLSRTAMVDTPDNNHTAAGPAGGPTAAGGDAAGGADGSNGSEAAPQEVQEPTFKQLLRVGVTKGLPFVAFGFFDNIIMITAGEQIDLMFGAKLGLSSMAAAGLGNTVADVVGINISHTIERKFKGMKSMAPALTKAQLALPRTQRAKWLGCAIGMASGCLLGLTPLLFYDVASHSEGGSSTGSSSSRQHAPAAAAT